FAADGTADVGGFGDGADRHPVLAEEEPLDVERRRDQEGGGRIHGAPPSAWGAGRRHCSQDRARLRTGSSTSRMSHIRVTVLVRSRDTSGALTLNGAGPGSPPPALTGVVISGRVRSAKTAAMPWNHRIRIVHYPISTLEGSSSNVFAFKETSPDIGN